MFCNGTETCNPGTGCVAGTPPATDDGIACSGDACNEATDQVTHTPNNALCDDGNPNTIDSCNPTTGCQNISGAGIPTHSEWGLILMFLLTIAFSTVLMTSPIPSLAAMESVSTFALPAAFFRQLPFDKELYKKVMFVLLPLTVIGFFVVHFTLDSNGALDFTGTLVSACIVGYIVQVIVGRRVLSFEF